MDKLLYNFLVIYISKISVWRQDVNCFKCKTVKSTSMYNLVNYNNWFTEKCYQKFQL